MKRALQPRRRDLSDDQEGPSLLSLFIMLNLGVFVFQNFVAIPPAPGEAPAGYISQEALRNGIWWSVFTHLFVHLNWLHLGVNMALLWLFGRRVLADVGARHFTYLYFLGGWIGTALQLFIPYGESEAKIVGASGSAFAIMAAFATLHPFYSITEKVRKFIPFRLKARNFVICVVIAELALDIVQRFQPGWQPFATAHLCHVGGALLGWLYLMRLGGRQERSLSAQWSKPPRFRVETFYEDDAPFAHAAKSRPQRKLAEFEELPPPMQADPLTDQEFIKENVNPVLEKLHERGMESLTADERRILHEAAKRLGEPEE